MTALRPRTITLTEPTYFPTEADFRRWLATNHETATELLLVFGKKRSSKQSIDWPQAWGQAQPFGWIDGMRCSPGEEADTSASPRSAPAASEASRRGKKLDRQKPLEM